MKIKYSPMPGLTIITLIFCAILFSLGTWQYKRLTWKTDLIVKIDQAANAVPLRNLAQIERILKSGQPLDFRRVQLNGTFVKPKGSSDQALHLLRSDGKRYYWRLYQPYQDGANLAFIATHIFAETDKEAAPEAVVGAVPVIGYVRMVQDGNVFTPKSTPSQNRWFAFNGAPETLDWAKLIAGQTIATTYFIDMDISAQSANDLAVRKPELVNNHLDYMLTWYSFIIILLSIYGIIHYKAGRLRFNA